MNFDWVLWLILGAYSLAALGLMIYGLNTYVLLFLYGRRISETRERQAQQEKDFLAEVAEKGDEGWPLVTTQIPLYNELNVADRVIRKVAEIDYPEGRHQIQVVDDSTDETRKIVDEVVEELSAKGINISVARREGREGYKAGGLKAAEDTATGEFLAIFDSDFLPEPDFLRKMIPLFRDEKTALVQARWGQ